MSNFTAIDNAIKDYSLQIAQDLSDIRFWEVDKIKASIYTKLFFAIKDCATVQTLDCEKRRAALAKRYQDPAVPIWAKQKIASQLAEIKLEKKEFNQLYSKMEEQNEKYHMINWLKQNGYQSAIDAYRKNNTRPDRMSIKDQVKSDQP